MRDQLLLFIVLFSLIAALFVTILVRRFGQTRRVRAVVLDKEAYTDSGYLRDGEVSDQATYIVKFQTDTQVLNLSADPFLYEGLRIGDRGILYYRDNKALRFIRAKE